MLSAIWLRSRWSVWTLALACLLPGAGCGSPGGRCAEATREGRWKADIAYFAREFPAHHKNAFFKCSKESFEAAAEKLRDAVPRLGDDEVIVGILRLVAMVGDGHSQAQNYMQVGGFHSLPVMFEWMRDGYYAIRASRSHEAVLGMRVIRVGRTPIDQAARRLGELFPAENEQQVWRRVAASLRCPELLHGCGLIAAKDATTFTFANSNGVEKTVDVAPIPSGVELRWVYASEVATLAEQQPLEAFWCKVLRDRGAVYLAYNSCREFGAFRSMCSEMFRTIDEVNRSGGGIERLIIDLRRNGGGNSMVIDAIHWHLAWHPKLRERGHLLVLVGRGTFSSAMMNAVQLRKRYGAVLIGEPTGGSPNGYGEIKPLTLPCSRLVVMYSTEYFALQDGGGQTVTPDMTVEPSIEDYIAGRDPVLESALAYPGGAASKGPANR